jgi:hypothetical protein
VLLGVWLYGFMSGVRSSRKLEAACRDQVPDLWLSGWQRPDHTTLWRCSQGHRQAMRRLLKRTVRVAGSAARERTLDAVGLTGLLERTGAALADLEAQTSGGDEPPPPRLPDTLTQLAALRTQVQAGLERVTAADGPARTNLTDPDATLQQARNGGFVVGYHAQALVAGVTIPPPDGSVGPGGRLIPAAAVTTDRGDHGQVVPRVTEAVAVTGAPIPLVLADGGSHSAANLAAWAARDQAVLVPDPPAPRPGAPDHTDRFVDAPATDTFTCPQGQTLTFQGLDTREAGGPSIRRDRASKPAGDAGPVRAAGTSSTAQGRSLTVGPDAARLRAHRTRMATEAARTADRRRQTVPEPAGGILTEPQAARRCLLRGLTTVQAQWSLLATAVTLRTLARVWRSSGRPRLAPAA